MDTIGPNTPQTDRAEAIGSADTTIPVQVKDMVWGAFCGGEMTDGAGVVHLVEGRFQVTNNNVTQIYHAWGGDDEILRLDRAKIDDFWLDPYSGRLRVRGHEFGPSGVFRAIGSCRATVQLRDWTPLVRAPGAYPEYDAAKQTFFDVPPGSPFHRYIEGMAAIGAISGYQCGGPGEPCDDQRRPYFRPGNNVTRSQQSKVTYIATGGE
jgi:hypothetical protein